ncbi:MAG: (2Fe-2S)-binding protein [Burkholderiaceae bacterium]
MRPEQQYRDKAPAKAYKVAERNGLIWVYMGKQAEPPPMPMIEATLAPADETSFRFVQRECNWLQALEGDIDTSHFGFLHAGSAVPDDFQPDHPMRHTVVDRAPEYQVIDTPWGTCYGAHRLDDDGRMSWRIANFMLPFWTQAPNADFDNHVGARAWVPMDDEHTMVLQVGWKRHNSVYSGMPLKNGKPIPGFQASIDFLPNETGWHGRHRPRARTENDYEIDRAAQRANEVYTGIRMIFMQDQAVTESMGAISDHGFEHLGASDQMVARTRRRVFKAATALAESGQAAPGSEDGDVFWGARSGSFHIDPGEDWQRAYYARLAKATRVPIEPAPTVAAPT